MHGIPERSAVIRAACAVSCRCVGCEPDGGEALVAVFREGKRLAHLQNTIAAIFRFRQRLGELLLNIHLNGNSSRVNGFIQQPECLCLRPPAPTRRLSLAQGSAEGVHLLAKLGLRHPQEYEVGIMRPFIIDGHRHRGEVVVFAWQPRCAYNVCAARRCSSGRSARAGSIGSHEVFANDNHECCVKA